MQVESRILFRDLRWSSLAFVTAAEKRPTVTRPDRTALTVLVAHNLIQNEVLDEKAYVTGNLIVTSTLLAIARSAGLDRDDIGLQPGDLRSGASLGLAATITSLLTAVVAARLPSLNARLRDQRLPAESLPDVVRRALIRFPIGTALFEEVAFRGVLPPLLSRDDAGVSGDARSALVFALWHLIPTHQALRVNNVGQTRLVRLAGTLVGAMAAGVAGYALSRVRRRTGSLLASWLIHSSVNAGSYLATARVRLHSDGQPADLPISTG